MSDLHSDDPRWLRLLGATRSHADPAVLARVRARLAAPAELPAWFAWLGSPAALVAACALLVVTIGASIALTRADSTRDTTLVSALIGDDGSYGLPGSSSATAASTPAAGETGGADSEGVAR